MFWKVAARALFKHETLTASNFERPKPDVYPNHNLSQEFESNRDPNWALVCDRCAGEV
jgi:hypothetical protein